MVQAKVCNDNKCKLTSLYAYVSVKGMHGMTVWFEFENAENLTLKKQPLNDFIAFRTKKTQTFLFC